MGMIHRLWAKLGSTTLCAVTVVPVPVYSLSDVKLGSPAGGRRILGKYRNITVHNDMWDVRRWSTLCDWLNSRGKKTIGIFDLPNLLICSRGWIWAISYYTRRQHEIWYAVRVCYRKRLAFTDTRLKKASRCGPVAVLGAWFLYSHATNTNHRLLPEYHGIHLKTSNEKDPKHTLIASKIAGELVDIALHQLQVAGFELQ